MSKLIEWATYGKFGRPIEPVEKDPFENYVGLSCSGTIAEFSISAEDMERIYQLGREDK